MQVACSGILENHFPSPVAKAIRKSTKSKTISLLKQLAFNFVFLDREIFFSVLDVAEEERVISGDTGCGPCKLKCPLTSYSSSTANADLSGTSAETWLAWEASLKATNLTGKTLYLELFVKQLRGTI